MANPERQPQTLSPHLRVPITALSLAVLLASMVVVALPAQSQTFKVLHSFTGGVDGQAPVAGLVRDGAGNLYGTTDMGGSSNFGAVFKVSATGAENVLYSFTGGADGGGLTAGLIRVAGILYGTAQRGLYNSGVVFKVDATGKETVLYTFTGKTDGASPSSGLIRDSAGNLYGTTGGGGALADCNGYGCGVVFKLDSTGKETVLYNFTGGTDGTYPEFGLIRDSAGNLYGTAFGGGGLSCNAGYGCGVVFKLDTTGKQTVLYTFTGGTDGGMPSSGLIRDGSGNLYGSAVSGGTYQRGVIFKVTPTGKETVLHNFTGGADGAYPWGGVIRDSAGNLYGTANTGGALADCYGFGCGVVYKLDPLGNLTVLHSFTAGTDGAYPYAGLVRDTAGNLYGTANYGGSGGAGTVFEITP